MPLLCAPEGVEDPELFQPANKIPVNARAIGSIFLLFIFLSLIVVFYLVCFFVYIYAKFPEFLCCLFHLMPAF